MPVVLLAVDETAASEAAARAARRLFGADATYLAVNVAQTQIPWMAAPTMWGDVSPYVPPYRDPNDDAATSAQDAVLDEARTTAHDVVEHAGVAAAAAGEIGDPAEAILRAADEHHADVIVVGSSDKGWWRRLVDGSVSADVVRHAEQPVLVIPEPDRVTR